MATTLGSKAIGSIVKVKENGILVDYMILVHGRPSSKYDESCNGTWLLRKTLLPNQTWAGSNTSPFPSSTIYGNLNNSFFKTIAEPIRNQIKQVALPYKTASGVSTVNTHIFLLSAIEVGIGSLEDGSRIAYFSTNNKRKAYFDNGDDGSWWTRSWYTANGRYAVEVIESGGTGTNAPPTGSYAVRPAFVLPSTLYVSDSGEIIINSAPSVPGEIVVPTQINGGSSVTISWSASTDAEDNLEGYKVERSTDGGSTWTQIYQGNAQSTTNTVAFGTASVMYRVRAYDSEGLHSGWRTSSNISVINNRAPTAPGSISVPITVNGGKPLTISWTAGTDSDGNLSGYALERQNNGGTWSEIYRGTALTYTDSVPKGLQTVAYRVRAYDTLSAYGPYTTSETRTVNNNTAPVISCTAGALGVKSEGFTVPYSVSDEDGDTITITEAIDSKTLRTFQTSSGKSQTINLTGTAFMQVLNGQHNLTITASDGKEQSVHKLTFSKSVTSASVTLAEPLPADAPITVCALSVGGNIPADADYTVEVTNNALAAAPVWEDCTSAVRSGANVVFKHKPTSGHGFNFRLSVSRGPSGQGGYITSIQGGFQ
jgi:hypothetical protein